MRQSILLFNSFYIRKFFSMLNLNLLCSSTIGSGSALWFNKEQVNILICMTILYTAENCYIFPQSFLQAKYTQVLLIFSHSSWVLSSLTIFVAIDWTCFSFSMFLLDCDAKTQYSSRALIRHIHRAWGKKSPNGSHGAKFCLCFFYMECTNDT